MDVNFPYLVRTVGGNVTVAGFRALIDAQQWAIKQGGPSLYYIVSDDPVSAPGGGFYILNAHNLTHTGFEAGAL